MVLKGKWTSHRVCYIHRMKSFLYIMNDDLFGARCECGWLCGSRLTKGVCGLVIQSHIAFASH